MTVSFFYLLTIIHKLAGIRLSLRKPHYIYKVPTVRLQYDKETDNLTNWQEETDKQMKKELFTNIRLYTFTIPAKFGNRDYTTFAN